MPGLPTTTAKLNQLISSLLLGCLLALPACEDGQSGETQSHETPQPQSDVSTETVPPKAEQSASPSDWSHQQASPSATAKVDEQHALQVADLAILKYHRAHPRACYDRFHKVWQQGNVDKAFKMLTPFAQQQLAGIILSRVGSAEPVPEDALHPHDFVYDGSSERGSDVALAISALLKKRGIESVDKLYKKHWPDDHNDLSKKEQDAKTRNSFYDFANAVGPPNIFIKDVMRMIDALKKSDTGITRTVLSGGLHLTKYELIDVEIEKDQARGWYEVPGRDEQYSVSFVRNELGWQINQMIPYHYNIPGIGYYRDAEGVVHSK